MSGEIYAINYSRNIYNKYIVFVNYKYLSYLLYYINKLNTPELKNKFLI